MRTPEHVQELRVADRLRVKIDLDRLAVVAEGIVGRVLLYATGIADTAAQDPIDAPKLGVGTPESTESKGRGLILCRHLSVQFWDSGCSRRCANVCRGRIADRRQRTRRSFFRRRSRSPSHTASHGPQTYYGQRRGHR